MAREFSGRRVPPVSPPPTRTLSLLVGLAESLASAAAGHGSPRSSVARSFGDDGAVGLGIVAAMDGGSGGGLREAYHGGVPITRAPRAAAVRSSPIPIMFPAAAGDKRVEECGEDWEEEDTEISESYTCVISHVNGATVRKHVYVDSVYSVFLFDSPPSHPRLCLVPPAEDFLSRCFRCRKKLRGLDLFTYR